MRMFQATVVALAAVLAVLDHHQAKHQTERVAAIAANERHVAGDRDAGGLEANVREELQSLVSTGDNLQIAADAFVPVVNSEETQVLPKVREGVGVKAISMLAVKVPRLLSREMVSPREVKLLSVAQSGLRMPIELQATHHSEVGFVAGSVGLFPSVRWSLNDRNFDPEQAGVGRAFTENASSSSLKPNFNRVAITVGCFSQSLAIQYSRSLTPRMEVGVVAGTSVGGFRTPSRGWNVSETFVVDAVVDFQWFGMVVNHRPFQLHGLGKHMRIQMGLYSGRNNVELTSRNSGDILEGAWNSRASVYLGIGGDLNLTSQLSLILDAGGLCVANPRISRGTPSDEMVEVAKSVADAHLFGQCRLGLSRSF